MAIFSNQEASALPPQSKNLILDLNGLTRVEGKNPQVGHLKVDKTIEY